MKKILFILIPVLSFGQDMIYLKDESKIESKVTEITKKEIKYKTYSNLDGPTRSLSKYEIAVIIYENGEHETFQSNNDEGGEFTIGYGGSDGKILDKKFGLIAGYTLTNIWGKESDDMMDGLEEYGDMVAHRGYRFGFFYTITYEKMSNTWELAWTRRGFREDLSNVEYLIGFNYGYDPYGNYYSDPIYGEYDDGDYRQINYQYVELSNITQTPFFENDNINMSFDLGTYLSVLAYVHQAEKIDGDRDTETASRDDTGMSFLDFGLLFGGSINYDMISITPRYRFGLGRIDEDRDVKINWSVFEISMKMSF